MSRNFKKIIKTALTLRQWFSTAIIYINIQLNRTRVPLSVQDLLFSTFSFRFWTSLFSRAFCCKSLRLFCEAVFS